MGSGEMAPDELAVFFTSFIKAMLPHLKAGAVNRRFEDVIHEPWLGRMNEWSAWSE